MNQVTKVSTAVKTVPVAASSNKYFPRAIQRPDGAVITVNDHHQMSAHMGKEYGPDAKRVFDPEVAGTIYALVHGVPPPEDESELAVDSSAEDQDPAQLEPGPELIEREAEPVLVKRGSGRPRRLEVG